MAKLTPNTVYTINGVTVNEKIIPDGTRWKDAGKAKEAGFSAGSLYKKQQKLSGNTGKVQWVTIHNTNDLPNVYDDGEQYTRATYNENMGSARVHLYVDDTGAWQNLKMGTGLCSADPPGSAEVSWHSGDGSVSDGGNMTSLSIEIIMDESPEHDLIAKENGARIAAWLLWKHGLTLDRLVTHTYWVNKSAGKHFSDVDDQCCNPISGRKWCPTYIFGSYNSATAKKNWKAFKELVKTYMKGLSADSAQDSQVKPAAVKSSAEAVLKVAISQIGYLEKDSNSQLDSATANAGDGNYTKYARDFDQKYPNWYNGKKNGYAWCDMFVDWCFLTAFGYTEALRLLCQPEKSAGAGCTYSLGYYKKKGQYHASDPKPGDQIFFGASINNVSHTGIVEKVDRTKVYTIEGNTSNKVARRVYSLNDTSIVGYGRPDYDCVSQIPSTGTTAASYQVRIEVYDLNIRTGAGTHTASKGYIKPGVYTIIEESDGPGASKWGKLKSGVGWVSLDYCKRVGGTSASNVPNNPDSDFIQAIDKLTKLDVINSPDYWKKAAETVQYLDLLIIKAANKITADGPRFSSVTSAIDQLVKDGVINTPDYWREHYQDCSNLGALLCALAGAKKG